MALFYILFVGVVMFFEERFIFIPSKYPEGEWDAVAVGAEDVWFTSDDGTRLNGWYFAQPDPHAVVLYCHGNAGNLTHRSGIATTLHELTGVSVLVFDYRGYGRSEGKPDEPGVLADARAARSWLAERAGIDPSEVVLLGRSLGGAVAVDLAAKDGARALVLESTFTSVPDMAARQFPFLPCRTLMRTRLDSLAKIADYHGPLLQSHGREDTIVPFAQGRRLFEAANEPKQFVPIEAADHNDPQPLGYYTTLREFLDRHPR